MRPRLLYNQWNIFKTIAWIFRFSTCMFTSRLYKGLFSLSNSQLTLKSPRMMMFSGERPFSTSVIAWHSYRTGTVGARYCPIFMTDYYLQDWLSSWLIMFIIVTSMPYILRQSGYPGKYGILLQTAVPPKGLDSLMELWLSFQKKIIISNIIHVIRILTTKYCFSKYVKYQHMNSLNLSASQCVYAQTLY